MSVGQPVWRARPRVSSAKATTSFSVGILAQPEGRVPERPGPQSTRLPNQLREAAQSPKQRAHWRHHVRWQVQGHADLLHRVTSRYSRHRGSSSQRRSGLNQPKSPKSTDFCENVSPGASLHVLGAADCCSLERYYFLSLLDTPRQSVRRASLPGSARVGNTTLHHRRDAPLHHQTG